MSDETSAFSPVGTNMSGDGTYGNIYVLRRITMLHRARSLKCHGKEYLPMN